MLSEDIMILWMNYSIFGSLDNKEKRNMLQIHWKSCVVYLRTWPMSVFQFIGTTMSTKSSTFTYLLQVIQCLYEAWKAFPESAYAKHYIAGSRLALDNDLYFFNQSRKYPRFVRGENYWGAN